MNDYLTRFGTDARDHLITDEQFLLPDLNPNSHKGDNGRVLIIGGSPLFHGAGQLASIAAIELIIRITSITNDAVFFCSTPQNIDCLKKQTPIFIGIHREEVDEYVKRSDVILAGPGLMREPQIGRSKTELEPTFTKDVTKHILQTGKKLVLDAGSIQVISPDDLTVNRRTIITPHHTEMGRLFKIDPNTLELTHESSFHEITHVAEKIQTIAKTYNTTILLKGPIDVIAGKDKWFFSPGGNAGMTKGGSGDVLAGVTAALYHRIDDPILTAAMASYVLKRTAESLFDMYKDIYDALDVTQNVGKVFEQIRNKLH